MPAAADAAQRHQISSLCDRNRLYHSNFAEPRDYWFFARTITSNLPNDLPNRPSIVALPGYNARIAPSGEIRTTGEPELFTKR
jgi:hypothetical protein